MIRDPRDVEHAFKRVRWQDFVYDLKRSWFAWLAVIALVGAYGYYSLSPRHVVATVRGTAAGAHQPPTDDNSLPMFVSVRLDTNRTVNVALPRGTIYRAGASVEVEVIRRDWPPHSVTYRFAGYAE